MNRELACVFISSAAGVVSKVYGASKSEVWMSVQPALLSMKMVARTVKNMPRITSLLSAHSESP